MPNESFSFPTGWKSLDNLLEKLPRSIKKSNAIVMSVDYYLKQLEQKSNLSLDDFKDSNVPRLDADLKIWKELVKPMNSTDLRELQQLLQKRKSLVDEAIYRKSL